MKVMPPRSNDALKKQTNTNNTQPTTQHHHVNTSLKHIKTPTIYWFVFLHASSSCTVHVDSYPLPCGCYNTNIKQSCLILPYLQWGGRCAKRTSIISMTDILVDDLDGTVSSWGAPDSSELSDSHQFPPALIHFNGKYHFINKICNIIRCDPRLLSILSRSMVHITNLYVKHLELFCCVVVAALVFFVGDLGLGMGDIFNFHYGFFH